MLSHTQPSAHVCTPPARRPARKASASKPKARPPKLLFPPLPEQNQSTEAELWRAAFLRDLYMLKVGQGLLHKSFGHPLVTPSADRDAATLFLSTACSTQYSELRKSFNYWVCALGGLASGAAVAQGGAA